MKTVCVVGGGGYVGSALVPRLLERDYTVIVLDLFIYGEDVLPDHTHLFRIRGDVRDLDVVTRAFRGCDMVIHLACISNDPSFELDPGLGKSINYDSFRPLVYAAKSAGVTRFIYASSSSVYGVKEELEVTEKLSLAPITDYSRYKVLCEDILLDLSEPGFDVCIARPATVCGYAPRQRLDVIVNIMTNDAISHGTITVHGGTQTRPNIHIQDMVDAYLCLAKAPRELIDQQIFNIGGLNHTVTELAKLVRLGVGSRVDIIHEETNDPRSYRISSNKIETRLGFTPKRRIISAVQELAQALREGRLPNSLEDSRYYNIKRMQEIGLK